VHQGLRQGIGIAAAVGLLVVLSAVPAQAAQVHRFANGITATVYSPEEITDQWTSLEKNGTYLTHPSAGMVELVEDGPAIHPFNEFEVVTALESMHGFTTAVDVDVFILPAVPAQVGSSFARRNAIYLAPGTGPIAASTEAYITTHEMGHVLTWAFIDEYPARWSAYLAARGLDTASLDANVIHADRPREILAEDIRALFGGPLATVSRSIENHELVYPVEITGLKELLAGFFLGGEDESFMAVSSVFPNPCNPRTTIEMAIPTGAAVQDGEGVLRIFDIRGALVKSLDGGRIANSRLAFQWDGTGRSGEVVSSGRYLYVLEVGQLASKGSVTLVR
jgi:hypothetical protein